MSTLKIAAVLVLALAAAACGRKGPLEAPASAAPPPRTEAQPPATEISPQAPSTRPPTDQMPPPPAAP
ncbi:lipoprotein [Iodidimonas sp. SYSU 1G8]|uniref:LPS translocon maturation chaperone LptM n=1 Tax=Iodidimonas sp. SYSU 1G8 TaxID=3133967 RepID=UPI0031FE8078